jgi:hypothetical protein
MPIVGIVTIIRIVRIVRIIRIVRIVRIIRIIRIIRIVRVVGVGRIVRVMPIGRDTPVKTRTRLVFGLFHTNGITGIIHTYMYIRTTVLIGAIRTTRTPEHQGANPHRRGPRTPYPLA